MKAYIDILKYVLKNGNMSVNQRTGEEVLRVPSGASFLHNMADGFPLVTTKKMGLKNIATELEFFVHGYTDKKWLQDHGCHIWDEWANPEKWEPIYEQVRHTLNQNENLMIPGTDEKLKNAIMDGVRDLGPIYGWQWRNWGGEYKWNPYNPARNVVESADKNNKSIDQIQNIIDRAKKDPTDRGLIVNAWNPTDEKQMALRPCHVMHQILIDDGKLNLIWTQRSCDMFLGVPYNIASYALLLLLYAKELGYEPGMLRGDLHDVHIYANHLDPVKTQIKRKPYPLPTVEIPDTNWKGMLNWVAKDGFILKDYVCHSALRGEVAR